jgi:hypothetical protein
MLSPGTKATESVSTLPGPMTQACATPSGVGWMAYEIEIPNWWPSPISHSNAAA